MPRVTVLLAVHDGGDYLDAAVQSVLAQTYDDFELLIVDDASSDGAVEALPADPRIRVVRNDRNLGQVASLNRGLREARGTVVARLDADDVCAPERLERQVGTLDAEPDVALVGSWMQLVDESDRPTGSVEGVIDDRVDFVFWTLVQYVLIPHPAAVYLRAPVLELGGYDESMGPAEDKDLWRRLLLAGWDARIVQEPLVRYRVHGGQLSQTRSGLQRDNDDRSQEAMLVELAAGPVPVRALRLLLCGDLGVWDELEDGVDLPAALDALLAGTQERLELDDLQAALLRERIRRRVTEATRAAWRADGSDGWREHAAPLLDWANPEGSPGLGARGVAAPVLRAGDGLVGAAVDTVAHLPLLSAARERLRRSQALRRLYAQLTRRR